MLALRKINLHIRNIIPFLWISFSANALELDVRAALLMEYETGEILYEREGATSFPPASMSKLMTLYVVFDAIKRGVILPQDTTEISPLAWRQVGSRMFLKNGSQVSAENLIKGAIIHSGNDACVALAEMVAGSVPDFVKKMNDMAVKLGLKKSSFANVTGLPHPDHYMSAIDLAHLAKKIMKEFPQYYKLYSQKEFTWNNIKQSNRNPLLYKFKGADGIKTGHTNEAKYGLVGSAVQNNMRLISVISGAKTKRQRSITSQKILKYGFRHYMMRQIGLENFKVMEIEVLYGSHDIVKAVTKTGYRFPIKRGEYLNPVVNITYKSPLIAPIKKGQEIATLTIQNASEADITLPLFAKDDITKAPFWSRGFTSLLKHIL